MPEIILFKNPLHTLDEVLPVLHYIFLNPEDDDVVSDFNKILNIGNNQENDFQNLFDKLKKKIDAGETNPITLDSDTIFSQNGPCLTPCLGRKQTETGNIDNKGFVLGLEGKVVIKREQECQISYHVDYDKDKKLHINFLIQEKVKDKKKQKINFCLKLPNHSKRFGCSTKLRDDDEKSRIIQYKFWVKMTLGYRANQARLASETSCQEGETSTKFCAFEAAQNEESIMDFLTQEDVSLNAIEQVLDSLMIPLDEQEKKAIRKSIGEEEEKEKGKEEEPKETQSLTQEQQEFQKKASIYEVMLHDPKVRHGTVDILVRNKLSHLSSHRSESSDFVDSDKSDPRDAHDDSDNSRGKYHSKNTNAKRAKDDVLQKNTKALFLGRDSKLQNGGTSSYYYIESRDKNSKNKVHSQASSASNPQPKKKKHH